MIILPSLEQETANILCFDPEEQHALDEAEERNRLEEERGDHHGNGTH